MGQQLPQPHQLLKILNIFNSDRCNSFMCFQKVLNNLYKLWKTWIMEDLLIFGLKSPKVGNLPPEPQLWTLFRFFDLHRCNSLTYSQKDLNHFPNMIFSKYTSISSWPPILAHCARGSHAVCITSEKFRRDKLSDKKLSKNIFPEILDFA